MITEKELNATLLSPVKKDYYQIWNELLDTTKKLSERWDPTSTNESDPGIVLLKVLTACSDKLNYNIDKNILEAFMPSAAQEESMRKLCDILGYSMKYYRSATTTALISFIDDIDNMPSSGIYFPKFTSLKSEDSTVNYLTLSAFSLDSNKTYEEVDIIEGSLQQCETETDNIIFASQLDDNYRYQLPESQIAENGVFVYNLLNNVEYKWEQVSNLNTSAAGQRVYKFGYNSSTGLPYIQFPEDINNIIEDGLYIYYIRTNGVNGNISARKLSTFEKPQLWSDSNYTELYSGITTSMFSVANVNAATNGTNKETINQAYNNYKKIIGTFDTLVTCRDYINKIYNLTNSENDTTPLVSNIIVSDIKDDINHAITLCTFNDYGIKYSSRALESKYNKTVETISGETVIIEETEPQITNFNLILYPFKTVTGLNTKSEYDNSFKYNTDNIEEIYTDLEDYKTLSHNLILPDDEDVVCIKNYLKLNAKITTVSKVNSVEIKDILAVIKTAIYETFNARNLDFSEEIPYDSILECLEQADERIKNVSLDEPELYTVFTLADGSEYTTGSIYNSANEKVTDGIFEDYNSILGKANSELYTDETARKTIMKAKKIYNKLALRNILAGRIALFNYENNFTSSFEETSSVEEEEKENYGIFPKTTDEYISKLSSSFTIDLDAEDALPRTLLDNEAIQFRAPNFKTTITYPSYVNYFIKLDQEEKTDISGIPATFQNLAKLFTSKYDSTKFDNNYNGAAWEAFIEYTNNNLNKVADVTKEEITVAAQVENLREENYGGIFIKNSDNEYEYYISSEIPSSGALYTFSIVKNTYLWQSWVKQYAPKINGEVYPILGGLYKQIAADFTRQIGKYIDSSLCKYIEITSSISASHPFQFYYVPETHLTDGESGEYTKDGLGQNGEDKTSLKANIDYQLKTKEYLYINYTESETDSETNTSTETVINKYYGPGTIIKPNFILTDSTKNYNLGNKFDKTDGFDFRGLKDSNTCTETSSKDSNSNVNPNGLNTLGANEQIEIREPVVVTIDDKSDPSYFYFIINDNTLGEDDYIHLCNKSKTEDGAVVYNYRELQSGEYFFYTDKNKLDIAYYGNGTVIRCYGNLDIKKKPEDDNISEQEISESGLDVIPWISYHLTETSYLKLFENQFISLTKDDILEEIEISSESGSSTTTIVSDAWKKIVSAKYKFSTDDSSTELTALDITIDKEPMCWEVKSTLELNAGPSSKQSLNKDDKIIITYTSTDDSETTRTQEITGSDEKQVSFKTNYYAVSGVGELNTTNNLYNSEGTLISKSTDEEQITDFKIKVFDYTEVQEYQTSEESGTTLSLNNFNSNNWTKIVVSPTTSEHKYTTLHINLPESNSFALVMFHYIKKSTTNSKGMYFKAIKQSSANTDYSTPGIFNKNGWWDDLAVHPAYYFREGINVIKFSETCDIDIYSTVITSTDEAKSDTMIFSNPSVINTTTENPNGIDLDTLNYFYTADENTAVTKTLRAEELLSEILSIDSNYEFYYNCPVDNSTAIEINKNAEPAEKLSTETIWYDYNNINNKFVISEIDSGYLSDGITIARSSKL